MNRCKVLFITIGLICLYACSTTPDQTKTKNAEANNIPLPLAQAKVPPVLDALAVLPPPEQHIPLETYSASVRDVPLSEFLFALARDAKINIDIHPDIKGRVTINVYKQTLPKILERISKQVALRYQIENNNLIISPDTAYLQHYKVNYVNLSR